MMTRTLEGMIDDNHIKFNNIQIKLAPYILNGPDNQKKFFYDLLSMQLNHIDSPNDGRILAQLSLVESFMLNGKSIETSQFKLESTRNINKHWNTNYGPHGWHRYVGRFPPQVIRGIINYFNVDSNHILLDPFCGSGTTLVEARLLGIKAIGVDVCPLSALISRAKSTFPIDVSNIEQELNHFQNEYEKVYYGFIKNHLAFTHEEVLNANFNAIPDFPNLNRWFTPQAFLGASITLTLITKIKNGATRDIFLLALSASMRSIGNVDVDVVRAEYRKKPRENVEVNMLITRKIKKYLKDIKNIENVSRNILPSDTIKVIQDDIRNVNLEPESIDYIITSPPYGVESISYLRTHLLSYRVLASIFKLDPYALKNEVIGSEYLIKSNDRDIIPSSFSDIARYFEDLLNTVSGSQSKNRVRQMEKFFYDMESIAKSSSMWLKPNGSIAFVIGNKKIEKEVLPTDSFIELIFESYGLELKKKIKHKLKCNNSNSKVPWEARTISDEYIMIFKKVKN